MSDLKTQPSDESVFAFINDMTHPVRKNDAFILLDIYQELTQQPAKMWGSAIIGY